jgi:hypothetical protein
MASTYSTRLKAELIGSGEQANSWGNTTNDTFSKTFEEAISNVYEKNLSGVSSPYELTNSNGPVTEANNEMRQAAIRFYGHTTAMVIRQKAANSGNGYERIYTIINDGTANGTIQLQIGSSATSDIISPGGRAIIATNGTDFYTIAGGGSTGTNWSTITSATANIYSGQKIFVDTSSNAITLTLPSSPFAGDEIAFLDVADNFDTNALTINPNGKKVFGATANGTVSTEGAAFTLVFTGNTHGWKLTEK